MMTLCGTTRNSSTGAGRSGHQQNTGRLPETNGPNSRGSDRRKVELGNCARPYGTVCQHEHACLRCPVLQVDPKMLPRLEEIETDLLARRTRAEAERWLGEIEGIDLTLTFLDRKSTRLNSSHLVISYA